MRTRTLPLLLAVTAILLAQVLVTNANFLTEPAASESDATNPRITPLVRAVERAKAAVVNIHTERTPVDREGPFNTAPRKVTGMGTGILVDERGYILTNHHVVADVDTLNVSLVDKSLYTAEIVSFDRKADLAVIKIKADRPLPVIPLGTSSDLMLAETVIAVGNAYGYEHSVTVGVVSHLGRDVELNEKQGYKNLIQTDASINPGNSGGPLLNLNGDVVGINVAIRAGAQRIGFAIPIDDARQLLAKLLSARRLNGTAHGLVTRDVKSPKQCRVVVEDFEADALAADAGFQPGDVILQVGNVPCRDSADLERACLGHVAGSRLPVEIERHGQRTQLMLELVKCNDRPAAPVATASRTSRSADAVDPRIWRGLGVRLVPVGRADLSFQTVYEGGLKVTEVRPGSPAAIGGIKQGDVLVALHSWKMSQIKDVVWVLNHEDFASFRPLHFRVFRNQELRYGSIDVSGK